MPWEIMATGAPLPVTLKTNSNSSQPQQGRKKPSNNKKHHKTNPNKQISKRLERPLRSTAWSRFLGDPDTMEYFTSTGWVKSIFANDRRPDWQCNPTQAFHSSNVESEEFISAMLFLSKMLSPPEDRIGMTQGSPVSLWALTATGTSTPDEPTLMFRSLLNCSHSLIASCNTTESWFKDSRKLVISNCPEKIFVLFQV